MIEPFKSMKDVYVKLRVENSKETDINLATVEFMLSELDGVKYSHMSENPMEFVICDAVEEYAYTKLSRMAYDQLDFMKAAEEICNKEIFINYDRLDKAIHNHIVEVEALDIV